VPVDPELDQEKYFPDPSLDLELDPAFFMMATKKTLVSNFFCIKGQGNESNISMLR
jgi:hypothetical protein